jgi:hypothetical protein
MPSASQLREFSVHPHRRLRANSVVLSTVGATGATALLDAGAAQFYTLNDVGGRVWSLLCEGTTFAAIVDQLLREYDVAADILSTDTEHLLQQLANAGLLLEE